MKTASFYHKQLCFVFLYPERGGISSSADGSKSAFSPRSCLPCPGYGFSQVRRCALVICFVKRQRGLACYRHCSECLSREA